MQGRLTRDVLVASSDESRPAKSSDSITGWKRLPVLAAGCQRIAGRRSLMTLRKIIAFMMVSIDGYHETTTGELFWHNVDEEFDEFAAAQIDDADTLLFGRTTYLGMAEFWRSPAALEVDPGMAERMNLLPKIVVSGSLADADWAPSRLISSDAVAQLIKLKEQPGKDILLLGSSTLAASLLAAGVLDELRLMVNPVVLGEGHSVLSGAGRSGLELAAVRRFASGNVLLTYASHARS
jgi:dihydrofolate reductase